MADALIDLIADLTALPGSDSLFNPYDPVQDDGASIRLANLRRYLETMRRFQPDTLLLFEAPGYRGCALTGIPVTSERIMLAGADPWGLFGKGYQPTSDHLDGVAEITATILWNALYERAPTPPLIWNTVPQHPHQPGNRQSNRTPRIDEQRAGAAFAPRVIALFGIRRVLGVGRIAQRMLQEPGIAYQPVRHPSQGGKAEFLAGLDVIYK